MGYDNLSTNSKIDRWDRAQRLEQRLNPAERAARDTALAEARGDVKGSARFSGGPWHEQEQPVRVTSGGAYPLAMYALASDLAIVNNTITGDPEPGTAPTEHEYRLVGHLAQGRIGQYEYVEPQ